MRNYLLAAFFILILCLTAGCGGSSTQKDGEALISDLYGGSASITDTKSPIYGATVTLLPMSLNEPNETIRIEYDDGLPGDFTAFQQTLNILQASNVITLSRTGLHDFNLPADVTIPYNTKVVGDEIPIVLHWDTVHLKYSPVALTGLERDKGLVSFKTAHFSTFVVVVLNGWKSRPLPAVDTLFRPDTDGFFVTNFGAYDSPGGSCLGMANYASWYFSNKKASRGTGLHSLYKEGNPALEEDDQSVRELISRAYMSSSQYWAKVNFNYQVVSGEQFTGYYLLQTLQLTGEPQILLMTDGGLNGHAVNVYSYDSENGRFLIYDNNRPRETHYLSWTPETGFGEYTGLSWAEKFGFDAMHSSFSHHTMENLYQGVETGWSASKFAKIAMVSPSPSSGNENILVAETDSNIQLAGTISRIPGEENPESQRFAHIYLNGTDKLGAFPVSTDGDFVAPIEQLPSTLGVEIMIIISESQDKWRRGVRGFLKANIRVRQNQEQMLKVMFAGTGSGRVISEPTGIDCFDDCTALFPDSITVRLSAIPDTGQHFTSWSGACTSVSTTCDVTLLLSKTVTASFDSSGLRAWTKPVRVSSSENGFGNLPKVALRDNGDALLIWKAYIPNQPGQNSQSLYSSAYSFERGWAAPSLIESGQGNINGHQLILNSASGRGMAAWIQFSESSISGVSEYHVWTNAYDPEASWGGDTQVDNPQHPSGEPSVGVDEAGNAIVVWAQPNPLCCSIFANRYTLQDGWRTPEEIETEFTLGRSHLDPIIHMAPDGNAVAIWSYTNSNRNLQSVWSNRITKEGVWSSTEEILNKTDLQPSGIIALMGRPTLAGDNAGNAFMGMMLGTVDVNQGGRTQYQPIALRAQSSWNKAVIDISPLKNLAYVSELFIASGKNGHTLSVWIEPDGRLMAAAGNSTGAAWTESYLITASKFSFDSHDPVVVVDEQGNGAIAWSEKISTSGDNELFVAHYSSGKGWGTPISFGSGSQPSLAMNSSGDAILVWTSNEGLKYSVFESGR